MLEQHTHYDAIASCGCAMVWGQLTAGFPTTFLDWWDGDGQTVSGENNSSNPEDEWRYQSVIISLKVMNG